MHEENTNHPTSLLVYSNKPLHSYLSFVESLIFEKKNQQPSPNPSTTEPSCPLQRVYFLSTCCLAEIMAGKYSFGTWRQWSRRRNVGSRRRYIYERELREGNKAPSPVTTVAHDHCGRRLVKSSAAGGSKQVQAIVAFHGYCRPQYFNFFSF